MNDNKLYLKKCCDVKMTRPRIKNKETDWKGKDILDVRQFWVMSILAKRRSGKTTLIYNLIKQFATKNTIVMFYVPTFWKDDVYESIRKYLQKKKILYMDYGDIKENGVNNIEIFLEENKKDKEELRETEPEESQEDNVQVCLPCKFEARKPSEKKPKKEKKEEVKLEYMFIFDDMSQSLRDKWVSVLCKNSNHYRAKIILSSQSIKDLTPQTHAQLDYCILFKGFNDDSLDAFYERIEPNVSLEEFKNIYHRITSITTKGMNHFLLYDRANNIFRDNLSHQVVK